MDQRKYWVGFNLVKGIGSVRIQAMLDRFGSLELAWQAPVDVLRSAGLSEKIITNLIKIRSEIDIDKILEKIDGLGIQVITRLDENYPRLLKEIDQPPPVLYIKGSFTLKDDWAVAIVGTRRVTSYGRQVASEVANQLARQGVTIVSGLARGVDSIAHDAAIRAGGRTIAVLGCGVDRVYPPEHRSLAEKVISQGALISDYPPGTPPDSANFPPRNRIISGLSRATIVVEAGETSGALITATFSIEQGRDVFAVPGGIYSVQSKGTNFLIQQGARPLLNIGEIFEALNFERIGEQRAARSYLPESETEAHLLKILGREPIYIDEIKSQTGLPIDIVSATLAMMELKGIVRHVGCMNYVLY
jgi:DNA processing protein